MSQAVVERSCSFQDVLRYLKYFIFLNGGDAGAEDDFVCERDLDGRIAGAVSWRDTRIQ